MPVPGHALEVGVELEVLHRVLVVALDEAHSGDPLADDPEDPERDLVLVRAHHLDSPSFVFQDRGVVDPNSIGVGDGGLPVGIHGTDVEARVATREDLHHVLGSPARLILGLVEVGELHVPVEAVDHRLGLLRGREDALAGEIEVRVVQHEADVGQGGGGQGRGHDAAGVGEGGEPAETRLQRKPEADHEQDRRGRRPSPGTRRC